MTTTAVNPAQIDTSTQETLPPSPKGTVPLVGQFVALFRDGGVTTGWLMEEPTEQEANPAGLVHLEAQMITAEGVVVHARRTRQEWLDAERDDRRPTAAMLFALHRKRKAELTEIVDDAHEFADNNDLCGEFDRFLEEHGLPSRNDRDQYLAVRVEVTVHVRGAGRTEEDAYDALDQEQVFDAVREAMTSAPQTVDYELD